MLRLLFFLAPPLALTFDEEDEENEEDEEDEEDDEEEEEDREELEEDDRDDLFPAVVLLSDFFMALGTIEESAFLTRPVTVFFPFFPLFASLTTKFARSLDISFCILLLSSSKEATSCSNSSTRACSRSLSTGFDGGRRRGLLRD